MKAGRSISAAGHVTVPLFRLGFSYRIFWYVQLGTYILGYFEIPGIVPFPDRDMAFFIDSECGLGYPYRVKKETLSVACWWMADCE